MRKSRKNNKSIIGSGLKTASVINTTLYDQQCPCTNIYIQPQLHAYTYTRVNLQLYIYSGVGKGGQWPLQYLQRGADPSGVTVTCIKHSLQPILV